MKQSVSEFGTAVQSSSSCHPSNLRHLSRLGSQTHSPLPPLAAVASSRCCRACCSAVLLSDADARQGLAVTPSPIRQTPESRTCKTDFAESADGPGRKEPNHDPAGAGDASPPPSSPPCASAPAAAASGPSVAASVRGGVAGLSMPSLRSCSTRASTCAKPHWHQTIMRPSNFRKGDARSCRRR